VGAALECLPDLTEALREAPIATKRLLFDAFDQRVVYDKIAGACRSAQRSQVL
jgi:hypothetical protein